MVYNGTNKYYITWNKSSQKKYRNILNVKIEIWHLLVLLFECWIKKNGSQKQTN